MCQHCGVLVWAYLRHRWCVWREMENCAFCRDGFYSIHNPRVGVAALGVHFNNIGLQFQCRVQCRCCLLVLNSWEYINLPAFITRSYVTTPWVHQPLRFLVVRNGLLCPICRFLKVNVEIYHWNAFTQWFSRHARRTRVLTYFRHAHSA